MRASCRTRGAFSSGAQAMTFETAREFNLDPTICALSGGEDYELLFTVKQADYDKIKFKMDITIIGYITEPASGCNLITKAGAVHALKAQGWNAFPRPPEGEFK